MILTRDSLTIDSLTMDLRPLADSVSAAYSLRDQEIPAEDMTVEFESAGMKAELIMLNMYVQRTGDTTRLINYDAMIMYSDIAERE